MRIEPWMLKRDWQKKWVNDAPELQRVNAQLIKALEEIEDNAHCWSNQQIAAHCRDAIIAAKKDVQP